MCAATEVREVTYGTTAIAYTNERGRKQKTVAIGVDPVDCARRRAPSETPVTKLDEIVHRNAKLSIDPQRRLENLPPSRSRATLRRAMPNDEARRETLRAAGAAGGVVMPRGFGTLLERFGHEPFRRGTR